MHPLGRIKIPHHLPAAVLFYEFPWGTVLISWSHFVMTVLISSAQKTRIVLILIIQVIVFLAFSNEDIGNRSTDNSISNEHLEFTESRKTQTQETTKKETTSKQKPLHTSSLLGISNAINSRNNYSINADTNHSSFNCDSVLYPVPTITPHATPFSITSEKTPYTKSNFWTFSNFILAQKRFRCHESVTLVTQAEYSYILENLPHVLRRWEGPVSMAMYVPGTDFIESLRRLLHLRECSEHKLLVKDFVTVHLIFDSNNLPQKLSTELSDLLFSEEIDCNINLLSLSSFDDNATTYRKSKHISYPINVARNLARSNSVTYYVLVADIELYPSPGLIQSFLELASKEGNVERRAYVLPIFEVNGTVKFDSMPKGKAELVEMLKTGLAIPFHQKVCSYCHKIPKAEEWRKAEVKEGLHVFHVANRTGEYKNWEPIFIGRRDDPVYDERLSWNGLKDKMTQGYILCILGYEMHILDNAFLTHAPGIKMKPDTLDEERKALVQKQNEVISKEILPEVKIIWGEREGCVV